MGRSESKLEVYSARNPMKSKNAADDAVISRIYRELVKRPGSDVLRYYSIPRGGWAAFIYKLFHKQGILGQH